MTNYENSLGAKKCKRGSKTTYQSILKHAFTSKPWAKIGKNNGLLPCYVKTQKMNKRVSGKTTFCVGQRESAVESLSVSPVLSLPRNSLVSVFLWVFSRLSGFKQSI